MIGVVESIISKYYIFRNDILIDFNLIFLTIIVGILPDAKENIRQIINKLTHNIFYIFIIVCVGEVASLLGLTPQIEYENFNVAIFIILSGTILLGVLLHCIMFKDIIGLVLQSCKYIQYMIFFELFLLVITHHLELIEGFAGTLAIICIEMIKTFCENVKLSNEKKRIVDREETEKEYDYPNPDLYYIRKKQLKKFVSVLEQQKYEPYAIMVSGEWGSGKSSFIKALEKELDKDYFIWIQAGSEKTFSDTLLEISEKILEILKENNIFIESDNLIEKYFVAFSGILDETGLKLFNIVKDLLGMNIKSDSKEYLNSKLSELNKTVYIIIDDLDRCNEEYQLKMFKIIRESTELINCKTIFLVDKRKFLNGVYDANHIEKYISYTLDLCEVDYQDILAYFIEDILDDSFIGKMNPVLLKDRNIQEIKTMVCQFPKDILMVCTNEISEIDKSINNKQEKEGKKDDITKTMSEIEKNIVNSRKMKNYLKGIKRDINSFNNWGGECSEEYKKEDWIKAIIEVQFIKNILPKIFANIKMCRDIIEFQNKYSCYSVDVIFGLNCCYFLKEKKIFILNYIIYHLDVVDFIQVKTEKEKYLDELNGDRAVIDNICKYIEYSESLNDLHKVLSVVGEQKFKDYDARKSFIIEIFDVLTKQSMYYKKNTDEFLVFSRHLCDCMGNLGLSKEENTICIRESDYIINKIISDSIPYFNNALSIFFDIIEIENNLRNLGDLGINELFEIHKRIDKNHVHGVFENTNNSLECLKEFYKSLKREIEQEKYKDLIGIFKDMYGNINIVFKLCEFWDNIESYLIQEYEDNDALFGKYFMLQMNTFRRDTTFLDISNLLHALEILKSFYISKEGCYESKYSLILMRLSYDIVLLYKSQPDWFAGNETEVSELLIVLSEKVCKLDKAILEDDRDVIYKIKIYTYKFKTLLS